MTHVSRPPLTTLDGHEIGRFAFGCMQFGGRADAQASSEMYAACREAGLRHFDTAWLYTDGASEEILGKLIATERESLYVATKVGFTGGASAANMRAQFDQSRARLKLDQVDLLYLHRFDSETPLEDTLTCFAELQQEGLIRHVGLSNFAAWQVMKAVAMAARLGLQIDVLQPMYSLVKRQAEVEILPMCADQSILPVPYSPLGGGLLTGKYAKGGSGRLSEDEKYRARYGQDWMHRTAQDLLKLAEEQGTDPATLAVAWAAHHPARPAPILSARSASQLAPSLAATKFEMSPALYARIEALSPPPCPRDRSAGGGMTDFLVIGGGVAGIAAAAHLAELGSVLLLEREDALGYHASGRSAAMFEEDYGPPAIKALSRASRAYLTAPGAGRESYLSPRGLMLVGRADQRAGFETDLATLELKEIPVAEARARVPILNPETLAFAATHETATDIDTDRLMGDWAKLLRQRGGKTLTRQEVTAITRHGAGWRVETRNYSFDARQIVNAAGAWADIIAEMAGVAPVGLQPKRRSMAQLPAPEGHDVNGWPMLMGVHEAWYAKPQAGKLLVSPADADPVPPQDAWADDMVLAEGLARYEEMVTTPVTRLETSWAGLRSFAPDGVPVFGEDPAQAGFWWYAGQGGYGFQSAPASARLLRALVAGDTPEISADIVRTLCPGRFR